MQGIKTIYIIRHGQTDFNKKGIIQGSGVDTDLNETGIMQAQRFFDHYRDVKFDAIYTSALRRTQQTVEPFIKLGYEPEIMPELNEINWGIMEGLVPTEESTRQFLGIIDRWASGELDVAIDNGEAPTEMFERQKKGLEKIMNHPDQNTILICMHGRAMRSFLCLLTDTPLQYMDEFEHGNVCLYILDQVEQAVPFQIRVRNSRAHLHDMTL